jgi:hypothetical protein
MYASECCHGNHLLHRANYLERDRLGYIAVSPLKVKKRFGEMRRLHLQNRISRARNQHAAGGKTALLATYFQGFLLGLC